MGGVLCTIPITYSHKRDVVSMIGLWVVEGEGEGHTYWVKRGGRCGETGGVGGHEVGRYRRRDIVVLVAWRGYREYEMKDGFFLGMVVNLREEYQGWYGEGISRAGGLRRMERSAGSCRRGMGYLDRLSDMGTYTGGSCEIVKCLRVGLIGGGILMIGDWVVQHENMLSDLSGFGKKFALTRLITGKK
ncbi:hypothetical protein Tco_0052767 [Tanacetum coccineum]